MYRTLTTFFILYLVNNVYCQGEFVYYPEVRISYRLHSVPQNWLDAKTICSEIGAKLAMPMNDNEAFVIRNIFEEHIQSENSADVFMFLDSHDMFSENEFITKNYHIEYFYHAWSAGQPSGFKDRNCLVMDSNGTLHDQYCSSSFVYICQVEDSSYDESLEDFEYAVLFPTDPTYRFESTSKKYFKLHIHKRTWPSARAICRAEGGRLAVIEREAQEEFLIALVNDANNLWPIPGLYYNETMVGHHDLYRRGSFYTITDQRLDSLAYINWAIDKPNYDGGDERCGSITIDGELSNVPCNVPMQFICERMFN